MPGGREKVTMGKVHWYINGSEVALENQQLPGTSYRRGDFVSAGAEIRRKEGEFILSAPAVTVQNALPDAVSADLSTLIPLTGDTVRVSASGKDPDGDGVTFRYHWFANDKLVEGETGDSFKVRKGMKGMWIQAEVQAFDGIAEGSHLRTPKVRVANAPPVVDQVEVKGDGYEVHCRRALVGSRRGPHRPPCEIPSARSGTDRKHIELGCGCRAPGHGDARRSPDLG